MTTHSLLILFILTVSLRAETFIVSNTNDTGAGSLRQAILDANAQSGLDNITFSKGDNDSMDFFDGTARVITTSSTLTITESINITGPGRDVLAIDGGGNSDFMVQTGEVRVFSLTGSTTVNPHRISGISIQNGTSTLGGACLRCIGSLELINCNIRGGRAIAINGSSNNTQNADGGGLFHSIGRLLIDSCLFDDNGTQGGFSQGGGFYTENGTADIFRTRIINNTTNGAVAEGGGIASRSTMLIEDCEISFNETLNRSSGGGGIYSDRNFIARQCTISNNLVGRLTDVQGYSVGGAFANVGGNATFEHCTIIRNFAPMGDGQGGGISSLSPGTISFFHTIIAENENSDIDRISATRPTYRDDGFNIFGSGSGVDSISSRQASSFYLLPVSGLNLGPLSFQGGLTRSIQPAIASLAVNAGSTQNTASLYDQRGIDFPRLVGSALDIGAHEKQTFIDTDSDGIPDAVENLVDGLNPNSTQDGALDIDSDGVSNHDEYALLGITSITNPNRRPSLKINASDSESSFDLSFPSSSSRVYQILSNNDLISPPTLVQGSSAEFPTEPQSSLTVERNGEQRFYFLQAQLPPVTP